MFSFNSTSITVNLAMADLERLLGGVDESEPLMILTLSIPNTDTEITGVVHKGDLEKPIEELFNVVKEIHDAAQKLKRFAKAKPAPVVASSRVVMATEDDIPPVEDVQNTTPIKQFISRQPQNLQGEASKGKSFRPNAVRNIVVSKDGAQKQDGTVIAEGNIVQDESWSDVGDQSGSAYKDVDDDNDLADQADLPLPPPPPRRNQKASKIDSNKNVSVDDIRRQIKPKALLQETESMQGVTSVQIPRRIVDEFGQTDITIQKFDDSKLQARIRRDPNFSRGNED